MSSPSFRPLYDQIKLLLTQSLIAGEWRPGEAIPSEIDLASRFGVSQGTVRKAVDELAAENILVRRQGKGTFVATHDEERTQFRFLRIHADRGETEYPKSQVVECQRGKASAEIANALQLRAGTLVYAVRRVLIFSGRPLVLDEIVLPAALFKGLTAARLNEFKGSVYGFYENEYGLRMIRAKERLKAVAADRQAAQHLSVPLGTPLLCVDRIAFTYGDRPVEWRRGLCHTDGHSYYTELA
jgi:GntR family transcriptional regulator